MDNTNLGEATCVLNKGTSYSLEDLAERRHFMEYNNNFKKSCAWNGITLYYICAENVHPDKKVDVGLTVQPWV